MFDTLDGLWQDALLMTLFQHVCARVKPFQVQAGLLWEKTARQFTINHSPHHNKTHCLAKGRDSQREGLRTPTAAASEALTYHRAAVPVGGFGWGDRRLFGRGCAGCTRRSSSVGTGENRGQSPGGWGGGSCGNDCLCHSGGCGGGVSFCSAAGRWGILSLRFICLLGSGGRSFGRKQRLAGNMWLLRRL